MAVDKGKLFQETSYQITNQLRVRQPTIREVIAYGEEEYWKMVFLLSSTPADHKSLLFDGFGLYFDQIDPFLCFMILSKSLPKKATEILLGDFDLSQLTNFVDNTTNELVLYNQDTGETLSKAEYEALVDVVRTMHGLVPNMERAGNDVTRKFMIDEDREKYNDQTPSPFVPVLLKQAIFMASCADSGYTYNEVLDLPLYVFSSIHKTILVNKHKQSAVIGFYSGLYSIPETIEKFDKKNFNITGELA